VPAEARRWKPLGTGAAATQGVVAMGAAVQSLAEPMSGAVRSVQLTNVTIAVTPAANTAAWGLDESVPFGVEVYDISHDGVWDPVNRIIKWAFFDATSRTVSYAFSGDAGAAVYVVGHVSFDGSEEAITGTPGIGVPLSITTWAARHGIPGDAQTVFSTWNAEYGQPNGLVYAFDSNIDPTSQLMVIRFVNGLPVIEVPAQAPATLPYAEVVIEGATNLGDDLWSLGLLPVAAQDGVPLNRNRWAPVGNPDRAFFRIKVLPR
jgi:hypothetical protein